MRTGLLARDTGTGAGSIFPISEPAGMLPPTYRYRTGLTRHFALFSFCSRESARPKFLGHAQNTEHSMASADDDYGEGSCPHHHCSHIMKGDAPARRFLTPHFSMQPVLRAVAPYYIEGDVALGTMRGRTTGMDG